jgi:exodeoxyribonuclease-5
MRKKRFRKRKEQTYLSKLLTPFEYDNLNIELNEQQQEVLVKLKDWWNNGTSQTFEISGAAGTGKTTLIKFLIKELKLYKEEVLFTAYVGKATLAMTRSGVTAKTIHSAITYGSDEIKYDENGKKILIYGREARKKKFIRRPSLDPRIKLIVVDEGSMVPEKLAGWLLSYRIPIIILGDLNQLPPVAGTSVFLKRPDACLTEIMRQADDSPIPYFAQYILRNGPNIKPGCIGNKIKVIKKDMLTDDMLQSADVVICGKNKTRDMLNRYIRENIFGITNETPVIGDKLICRENDWSRCINDDYYLINGLIGYVVDIDLESISKDSMVLDFKPDFLDECFKNVVLDRVFMKLSPQEKKFYRTDFTKFEYGYAITCHLSQGSQYNKVVVFYEYMHDYEYATKWLYTAVTRAIDELVVVI